MIALNPMPIDHEPMPAALADAPIGIFDSGVGGLSVLHDIARHLPQERFLYFADTAHVPYGPRDADDIRQLTARAIEWLYRQGCKIAVVACNSASAFSLDYLRDYYGERFPIIGLVPALKPAVLQSKTKKVAVLATPATFRGKLIKDVVAGFAEPAQVEVLAFTCLDLVPYVEADQANSPQCRETLRQLLDPAVAQGIDYLVLGCTHYPFLKQSLDLLYGDRLTLIDSGLAVARQTSRILIKHGLLAQVADPTRVRIQCVITGHNVEHLSSVLTHLIPTDLTWSIEHVNIATADNSE
ncbi:glutamate racemase [Acinetobacter rudis]|uniref:Glutamate racemase n=1 Tax=Acinetobacter rudis CIP 110305 TaxID=421052 RepID=S3MUP3_9GAMM|nr:glutamate racemase [Acinetobacter rudis]EPF70278.1 glutamate racemase [Acinetobacter rudis CIP 110305]